MKKIEQDELYQHLGGFLKTKGIELQEGSYAKRIRQGCGLLTEAINLTQQAVAKAKTGVDAKLEKMRQVIHQKTAPRPAPGPAAAPPNSPPPAASAPTAVAPPTPLAPTAAKTAPRKKAAKAKRPKRAGKKIAT